MSAGVAPLAQGVFSGITGRSFFYPCAAHDLAPFLDAFGQHVDAFTFVDLEYRFDRVPPIQSACWKLLPGQTTHQGPPRDAIRVVHDANRHWRDIQPAWLHEVYQDTTSERTIRVTRRRGFGQYALAELPDESLAVFCHRGDSSVNSGSVTRFLANHKETHPPLGMLFDKIKSKLALPALIVSDGSNTTLPQLRQQTLPDAAALDKLSFVCWGLRWQCVASLPDKMRRPTLVWRVEHAGGEQQNTEVTS